MAEYEAMAELDPKHVLEAMIARHNARMLNMKKLPPAAVEPVMSALLSIGYMDFAFRELGATQNRPPSSAGDNWVDHLAWGADSALAAARLLFSGQYLGASIMLRSQFERWTENAAYNTGVIHGDGESVASFAGRAWAKCHQDFPFAPRAIREDSIDADASQHDLWSEKREDSPKGPSILIGDDYEVHPAHLMDSMSNVLHGREPWIDAVRWEAGQLLDDSPPATLGEISKDLSDVLMLILRQIRLCLATVAEEQGKSHIPERLFSMPEIPYAGDKPPETPSLIPMLPDAGLRPSLLTDLADAAAAHAGVLRGRRPAGRLYRDDEFAHLHFYERRARAAKWAMKAFDMEKERTGSLDFKYLNNRNFRYLVIAEMSGLLSVWLKGSPAGDAAASCSSALRSAYWLWLEDDDRALAVLRILLEQCSRMRVWTEKPERAERLENSPSTTPKDWLNAAGWRRLSALNKALGEFSHAHANVRWEGAREILQNIQEVDMGPKDRIHTARGSTLDSLAMLLLAEAINSACKISPSVGASFRQIADDFLIEEDKLAGKRESFLNRTLAHKDAILGDYSFKGPADATRPDRSTGVKHG